jgi:hypothetical protein
MYRSRRGSGGNRRLKHQNQHLFSSTTARAQGWLDQMAERLAAAPDYQPLLPEESAATERDIDAFFQRLARDRR